MIKVLPILITLLATIIIVELIIERDAADERFSFRERWLTSQVERAHRIGTVPYFVEKRMAMTTKKQVDSFFTYLSRFTVGELLDIKLEVSENKAATKFLDSVIKTRIQRGLN